MELKELKCKNCGANLEVQVDAREVTCKFCHTKFAVESAENTGYEFEKGRMKAQREELSKNIKAATDALKTNGAELGRTAQNALNSINGAEIENAAKGIGKVFLIIFGVLFVSVFAFIVFVGINIHKNISNTRKSIDNTFDRFEVESVTNVLEMYSGTASQSRVKLALDSVVTNNKKNNYLITVEYKDIKTTNPDEIIDLKHALNKDEYEISLNYDKSKLVNKLKIEDIQ